MGLCERTIHILKIFQNLFLLYVYNLRVKTSHTRSRSKAVLYPTLFMNRMCCATRGSEVTRAKGTVRL